MIGANNATVREDPPEHTAAGIQAILTTLRTRLPQTTIMLLALFPRGASADDPLRLVNQAVNERVRAFADQRHVFFLDLGPHFLDKGGRLSENVMPDALHPNERGYRLWAEGMEDLVKTLMNESDPATALADLRQGSTRPCKTSCFAWQVSPLPQY